MQAKRSLPPDFDRSAVTSVRQGDCLVSAFARRVMFKPHSGRAFVRRLDGTAGAAVAREEMDVVRKPLFRAAEIELF